MDDSYCTGRPSKRNHPDVIVILGMPPRVDGSSTNYGGGDVAHRRVPVLIENLTMLATDYQGPLGSVFLSLIDRGTSSDMNAPPAPQCNGPVRAALRWATPPVLTQVNVYAGLFLNDSAFEAMPAAPAALGRRAAIGASGNQRIHQGIACGGCIGGNRKSRIRRDASSTAGGCCATAVRVSC